MERLCQALRRSLHQGSPFSLYSISDLEITSDLTYVADWERPANECRCQGVVATRIEKSASHTGDHKVYSLRSQYLATTVLVGLMSMKSSVCWDVADEANFLVWDVGEYEFGGSVAETVLSFLGFKLNLVPW